MKLFLMKRLAMYFRGIPASYIISTYQKAVSNNLDVSMEELETHYLAGGNPSAVVDALIKLKEYNIEFSWLRACVIDLASAGLEGFNIKNVVDKAIDTMQHTFQVSFSEPGKPSWNINVRLMCKINLDRVVGGAKMDLIEKRVKELIYDIYLSEQVTQTKSFLIHQISDEILSKKLDSATQYDVLDCKLEF